ncbi:WH1 domain containing protein [Aphelenchoides avenae]|nr:WH1 domain containing protein [Aphelenchus avenae]
MRRKRPLSTGTKLLTATENEKFKAVLGQDRVSLCAAIVQLLRTSREDPWSWQKAHTGVVSLVKDYSRRSFVIAVFDVEYFDLLWEQMLYENFQAKGYPNCPCLITFEGDNFMYGLNFADLEEARNFKQYLDKRYETEQKHHVAALQHESRGDIQPANLISADVRQAHVIRDGEPEAFGKVFEAWLREDEGRLHKVAIKHVETRSKEAFDRHMQEARLMLQFRHPYLLGCYEVYTYNNGCTYNVFVVMDCMSYGSLDVILTEMQGNHAFFSERSARYILFCCTQALAFLHS